MCPGRWRCRWGLGHVRFTKDVDFAVAVATDQEAEQLVKTLIGKGYKLIQVLEHEPSGRLATVRMIGSGSDSREANVDLLFASSGIEAEIVEAAEVVEVVGGEWISVVTIEKKICWPNLIAF